MLEILGDRQQALLGLLLETKSGLTVDELASGLAITRNAVRQHLAALENARIVVASATRPSGGRPHQLYTLTDKGHALFPRQYALLARLLVESAIGESGPKAVEQRMLDLGRVAGDQLLSEQPPAQTTVERTDRLVIFMKQMGYRARQTATHRDGCTIEADNCVFHSLAREHPAVCQFDLGLMSSFSGLAVEHQTCMAHGDNVCRFRLKGDKPV